MTNDRAYSAIAVSVLVSEVGKLINPIHGLVLDPPAPARKIALLASNVRFIVTAVPKARGTGVVVQPVTTLLVGSEPHAAPLELMVLGPLLLSVIFTVS